jgi:hypothetical protein
VPIRQVVDGPEGDRYVVTADRVRLAQLLTGTRYVVEQADEDDEWEVRVESRDGERVFAASSGVVAERLVVRLGEEIEMGLLDDTAEIG